MKVIANDIKKIKTKNVEMQFQIKNLFKRSDFIGFNTALRSLTIMT